MQAVKLNLIVVRDFQVHPLPSRIPTLCLYLIPLARQPIFHPLPSSSIGVSQTLSKAIGDGPQSSPYPVYQSGDLFPE